MTTPATAPLVETRRALHAVAEQVLASARYRADGHIWLEASPGGFATPWFSHDGAACRLAVAGTEISASDGSGERSEPLTTLRAAGELVGIEPGAPGTYPPATSWDLDAPLRIEPANARVLAEWFALVDAALLRVAGEGVPRQLWPEHFDLAVSVDEVNYGGSPGDDDHPDPYLYVGPWKVPAQGGFWNEPFGASAPAAQVPTVEAAVAFFGAARTHLAAG